MATPIALIIIYFLPDYFDKYQISVATKTKLVDEHDKIFYRDLDGDGNSEQILLRFNEYQVAHIIVNNHLDQVLDQWNFKGEWLRLTYELQFGDFDGDGFQEVYAVTISKDSVLLHIVEPHDQQGIDRRDIFIDKIGSPEDIQNVHFVKGKSTELTGDPFNEVVFGISATYSLQPRNVYLYDVKEDKVFKSPRSGALISQLNFFDIDVDGKEEVFIRNNAPNNITDSIPYPDSSAWLMVLDNTWEFLFDPVEFPYQSSGLLSLPLVVADTNSILALHSYRGLKPVSRGLYQFNLQGDEIRKWEFTEDVPNKYDIKFIDDEGEYRWIWFDTEGSALEFSGKLDTLKQINLGYCYGTWYVNDIDSDGANEFVYLDREEQRVIIARNDFSHILHYPLEVINNENNHANLKLNGEQSPVLSIQTGNIHYLLDYGFNQLSYLRYLIYLGVYGGVILFIWVIQKSQQLRESKRRALEQRLNSLRLQVIKSRIDPHFTFNALNGFGSVIYREDKEAAYNYFTKISRLIRRTLLDSEKIQTNLKDELDFVGNYLALQQMRFKNQFEYQINVSTDIDQHQHIPKMVIQTHVENALKHGLLKRKSLGHLIIDITQTSNILVISVKNDGSDLEDQEKSETRTGQGLKIMEEIYDLFEKINGSKISQEIRMNSNASNGMQTEVIVKIPLTYEHK